jgi:hypothetical protein
MTRKDQLWFQLGKMGSADGYDFVASTIITRGYATGNYTSSCRLGERHVEAMFKGKRNRQQKPNAAILAVSCMTTVLLADSALTAFFSAVLAILTVLTRVARVGTCTRGCGNVEWNLIDKKNR